MEARLCTLAAEQGLSLGDYVRHLLEQVPAHASPKLAPAERARAWRHSVQHLPLTPPLSDEAISRESIYAGRG